MTISKNYYESKHASIFWDDSRLVPAMGSPRAAPPSCNCPIQFYAMFNILYIFRFAHVVVALVVGLVISAGSNLILD